ncbi:anti-sigma factor family protein [Undibacterium sp. TJN25]|uniref:anti-sigma factor family protein n=1 Tax=Undibacterium sp. TJN25 TaxID=3413056 RepID=UPI003BF0FE46
MKPAPITEAELHAYVDGALPAARQLQVEAWLQAAPEDAERVRIYREQNASLRALFDPVLEEAVPSALHAAAGVPHASRHRPPARWSLQRIAAGIVLALASGAAGWVLHGWQSAAQYAQSGQGGDTLQSRQIASLPQQAAIAHVVFSPEVKHPVEVGADQEAHLVAWLSKRLGTPLHPPKLGPLGYDLVGGRLLPGSSGPVAQFMYTDTGGQRLTLYVASENSENRDTGFRFAQEGQVNVFYWIDGKFGYALSGGISKNDLSRIASSVYDQLQTK